MKRGGGKQQKKLKPHQKAGVSAAVGQNLLIKKSNPSIFYSRNQSRAISFTFSNSFSISGSVSGPRRLTRKITRLLKKKPGIIS